MIKIEVIGNLADNARVIRDNTAKPFCAFAIASNRKFTNKDSIVINEVTYIQCVLNHSFENLLQYLTKGSKVYVRGNLNISLYCNKEGKTSYVINCYVNEIELLNSKL